MIILLHPRKILNLKYKITRILQSSQNWPILLKIPEYGYLKVYTILQYYLQDAQKFVNI